MIPSRLNEKPYTEQMIAAIISKNRGMQICFKSSWCAGVFLLAMGVETAFAFDARNVAAGHVRVRSVVRADARTGRLVRSYVVNPRLVPGNKFVSNAAQARPLAASTAPLVEMVESVARKYDVDPLLVHSVIQVESGYNQYAVSHKGAQGLMQLMPATARRFGVTNSFDVLQNLEGGVRYLKYLDSLFPSNLSLTLAAYNAGEAAVWKYGNKIPPYRETTEYVHKVGTRYGKALRQAGKTRKADPVSQPDEKLVTLEPSYARVESFVDADGRLHLRTAQRTGAESSDRVSTP
jgi:hypothetical protein